MRPSALGDVSRTVPVAVSLKRAWPEAELHWLVNAGFEPVIEGHPAVDEVVSFPRGALAKFGTRWGATRRGVAFARTLRDRGYDTVYDVQGLARSGLLTWLTRAGRRVGFADARELGWLGSNVRHRVAGDVRHTVDRMLGLLAAEGVEPIADLSLHLRERDEAWIDRFVEEHGLGGGFVAVAPTARWASKCWPPDRFGEVAARVLDERPAWRALVLCSAAEREQARPALDVLRRRGHAERVITPETDVGQLAALLSRCALFLGNDSAPLHIAVGFDRPIVTVFGPTDPRVVGPYRRPETVVRAPGTQAEYARFARDRSDPTLIQRVEVEDVWVKAASCIASHAS